MRIFRANATEPNASFMNYAPSSVFNTSNIGPIQGDTTYDFKVKNYGGPTDLVIDVHGYWAADW